MDAHFTIAMKHVSMYVAQGNDVTTPAGLVTALRGNGGLANSAAELVRINRDNASLKRWEQLHASGRNGLPWIGRNNEYVYGRWSASGAKIAVSLFRYSGIGEPRTCQFSGMGVRKPTLVHPSHYGELNDICRRPVLTNSSIHELFGVHTGVIVLPQRLINRIVKLKNCKASCTQQPRFYTSAVQGELDVSCNDESENEADNNALSCANCTRIFTSEQRPSQHTAFCKQDSLQTQRNILSRATRLCQGLMQSKDIDLPSVREEVIVQDINTAGTVLSAIRIGWARREKQKQKQTPKHADRYKDELQRMFEAGAVNKAQKMSVAGMREQLIQNHGERFYIPLETDILRVIN